VISVFEVVVDPDMIAPQPFTILRSTGRFVPGGFESTVTPISMFGPVQQASNKEIQMLAEADRVGEIRSFWSTQPIYVTRGYAPVPGVHGELLVVSGTTYQLDATPPDDSALVYVDGLLLEPNGVDYTLVGNVLTLNVAPLASLYVNWQVTINAATNASDRVQYESDTYRVLQVYRDPGGGYWKCLATREAAA
jgi:hypothetical protein